MRQELKLRLIEGKFVCPTTDAPGFQALKFDPNLRSEVSNWLEEAGYQLNETGQGGAFYAAPRRIDASRDGAEILTQFKEAYEANAFARAVLDLVRSAMDACVEFKSGELLRSAEIFQAMQASDAHVDRLRKLFSRMGKKNKEVGEHEKLIAALDRLEELEYLRCENKALGNYRVCGKIEHMFDLIEYALAHSNLADSEDAQGSGSQEGASSEPAGEAGDE
jgi:hypothetical protein